MAADLDGRGLAASAGPPLTAPRGHSEPGRGVPSIGLWRPCPDAADPARHVEALFWGESDEEDLKRSGMCRGCEQHGASVVIEICTFDK